MSDFELIECQTEIIACGTDPTLGHPVIYLNAATQGGVTCPYCSLRYIFKSQENSN